VFSAHNVTESKCKSIQNTRFEEGLKPVYSEEGNQTCCENIAYFNRTLCIARCAGVPNGTWHDGNRDGFRYFRGMPVNIALLKKK